MRMMLKFTIPADKGNQAIRDGSLQRTLEQVSQKLKPEAAYFMPLDGKRAGIMVFEISDPADIAGIVEPMSLNLEAAIELTPVMVADDLKRALAKVSA